MMVEPGRAIEPARDITRSGKEVSFIPRSLLSSLKGEGVIGRNSVHTLTNTWVAKPLINPGEKPGLPLT
jgi:hypothetical protein